jgi:hypothetical protein
VSAPAAAQRGQGAGPIRDGSSLTATGAGTIAGRVTAARSGAPPRRVEILDGNGRENRLVTTDEDGRFALRDLTPGPWTVTASEAPGSSRGRSTCRRAPTSSPR